MIRTKIKVHEQRDGSGKKHYQRDDSTGNPDHDLLSAAEVENNPSKYEVTESTRTERDILRESFPEHQLKLAQKNLAIAESQRRANENKRKREAAASGRRIAVSESEGDNQRKKATADLLATRGFTSTDATNYSRTDVPKPVVVAADGSWKHDSASGKDKEELATHLDTNFPAPQESFDPLAQERTTRASMRNIQESFYEGHFGMTRTEASEAAKLERRIAAGLQALGLSEGEAQLGSRDNRNDVNAGSLLRLLSTPISRVDNPANRRKW